MAPALADQPLRHVARGDPWAMRAGEPDLDRLRNTEPGLAERHDCPRVGIVPEAGGEAPQRAMDRRVAVGADHDRPRPDETMMDAHVMGVPTPAVEEVNAVLLGEPPVLLENLGPLLARWEK